MKRETVTRHGRIFTVVTLDTPGNPRKRTSGAGFVKLPAVWANKLRGQSGRVSDVAIQVLFLSFRSYSRSFKLTNPVVEMDRWAKNRALRKLEHWG